MGTQRAIRDIQLELFNEDDWKRIREEIFSSLEKVQNNNPLYQGTSTGQDSLPSRF